ncbi:uncharacterized protein PG986_010498 [Apiospora aurea]|uniref:Uncharacterized protein n=1 Tax=Apiospora aurea TaxID=335848 RepID=A0ABR1Q2L0_9PEZI
MAGQSKMTGTGEFTPRETQLAILAWGYMETDPKIDFEKFYKAAGFANVRSCRVNWGVVKKKLMAQAAGNGDAGPDDADPATPTAPNSKGKRAAANKATARTGSKRKAPAIKAPAPAHDDDSDGDDLDIIETPSKKAKTSGVKKDDDAVKKEDQVKDEEEFLDEI